MARITADDIRAQVPWLRDRSDAEVAQVAHQVFAPQQDPRAFEDQFLGKPSAMTELGRGIQRAGHTLKGGLDFLAGGAASAFGDQAAADAAFASYDANMAAAARKGMRRQASQVRSVGDAVDFAAGVAGEALPTLAAAPLGAVALGAAAALPAAAQGIKRAQELMPEDSVGRQGAFVAGSTMLNAAGDALVPARVAMRAAAPGMRGVAADVGLGAAAGGATPLAERALAGLLSRDGVAAAERGGAAQIGEEVLGGAAAGAVSAGIARPVGRLAQPLADRVDALVARAPARGFRRVENGGIDLTQAEPTWEAYNTPAVGRRPTRALDEMEAQRVAAQRGAVEQAPEGMTPDLFGGPAHGVEPPVDSPEPAPGQDPRAARRQMQLQLEGGETPIYLDAQGQPVEEAVVRLPDGLRQRAESLARRAQLEQAPEGATLDMFGGAPRLPDAPPAEPQVETALDPRVGRRQMGLQLEGGETPIYLDAQGRPVPEADVRMPSGFRQRAEALTRQAMLQQAPEGATLDMFGGAPRVAEPAALVAEEPTPSAPDAAIRRRQPELPLGRKDPPTVHVDAQGRVVPADQVGLTAEFAARADTMTRQARLAQAPEGATLDMFGGPARLADAPAPESDAPQPPVEQPGQLPLDPRMLPREALVRELHAASKDTGLAAFRAGQPMGGKSPHGIRAILEAQDTVAAIREAYQDGGNPKAELLDRWHERLTGRKINDPNPPPAPAPAPAPAAPVLRTPVDAAAHQAATSPTNATPSPSAAQISAGNYAKGRVRLAGMDIAIENPQGSVREGVSPDGKAWRTEMKAHYGYVKGTKAGDGDAADVFIKPGTPEDYAGPVFVIDQVDPKTGKFDEHKTIIGVDTEAQARALYLENYEPGWRGLGAVTRMPVADFRAWVRDGVKDAPLGDIAAGHAAEVASAKFAAGDAPARPELGAKFGANLDLRGRAEQGMAGLQALRKRLLSEDDRWSLGEDIKDFRAALKRSDAVGFRQAVESLEANVKQWLAWEEANPKKSAPAPGFLPARFSTRLPGADSPVAVGEQLPKQSLQALAERIMARFPRVPPFEILESAQLLQNVRVPPGEHPSGGVVGGKIYLFQDGIRSLADAEMTVFHELFHLGVLQRYGDAAQWRQALLRQLPADKDVRRLADRWKASVEGVDRRSSMPLQDWNALAAEEALADMAEGLRAGGVVGTRRGAIVTRLVDWLAGMMDKLGLGRGARALRAMTYTDAERFVVETTERLGQTPGRAAAPNPRDNMRMRLERAQRQAEQGDPQAQGWLSTVGISEDVQAEVRRQLASGRMEGLERALSLMTTSQIVEQFGARVRGARDLYDALARKHGYAHEAAAHAENVTKRMGDLPKAHRDALANLMYAATEAELHPDQPLAKQVAEPTPADVVRHEQLAAQFAALDPAARAVYHEVRGVLDRQFTDVVGALRGLVRRVETTPEGRAERLKQIDRMVGKVRGPYFPLARFGDYVLIGKGAAPDGRSIVQHFESHAAQLRARDEMLAAGVDPMRVVMTRKQDPTYQQQVATPFVESMRSAIHDTITDPAQRATLQAALDELVIRTLPAASGAKSFLRRRNVAGYSTEAVRALADSVTRAGRYVANLRHTPDVNAALADMTVHTSASMERVPVYGLVHNGAVQLFGSASERLRAADALNDPQATLFASRLDQLGETLASAGVPDAAIAAALKRAEQVRASMLVGNDDVTAPTVARHLVEKATALTAAPSESAVFAALGSMAHIKYLGMSAAYWLTNLAQVPATAFPHLAGRFGAGRTARELGRAMPTASAAFRLLGEHLTSGSGSAVELSALKGVNAEERQALQFLADRGQLDITQSNDLAHVARGQSTGVRKAVEYITAGAHYTEVFNRMVTGLAGYRLAREAGLSHQAAMRQSLQDVELTQFNYAEYNKPAVMQSHGPLGAPARLLFMFLQYAQNTMYWWGRNVQRAAGSDPQARAEARKAMAIAATGLTVMGGAAGLPLAGTVHMLLNMALAGDDPSYDVEDELAQALRELGASDATAKALLRGQATRMGVDLSARVGQGDLLGRFGMTESAARNREMSRDPTRDFLLDLMGPAVGMVTDVASAVDYLRDGRPDRALESIPVKGLSDLIKAGNYATNGVESRKGLVLQTADELAASDIALRALGFQPATVGDMQRDRATVRLTEQRVQDRRARMVHALARAVMAGDADGQQEILDSVHRYNAAVAAEHPQLQLRPADLVAGVKRVVKEQRMLTLSGGRAGNTKALALAQQLNPGLEAAAAEF